MEIYNYDKDTKEFLGKSYAQKNPKVLGEYLYPIYSTTIKPPEVTDNETLIFNGECWEIVADYRGQEQINLETLEVSIVNKLGEISLGYMIYADYLKSELYSQYLNHQQLKEQYYDILSQINDLDTKRIRAICEPEVKDSETGETWLEYYTKQIVLLREKLKEVDYVA